MIRSFSFSNYKLFKDKVTIDFSANDTRGSLKRTIIEGEYNKVVAIYGGPSSGKSTILNALKLRSKEINFKADSNGEINAFHLDDMSMDQATQEYLSSSSMREFMIKVLQEADLGITDVLISKSGKIIFMHGSSELGVENASSGTIRLYCILVGIHKAIKSKGIAIWDECSKLHPALVRWLISAFYKSDAQLLVSTNINLEWMIEDDYFCNSQIYLVEKNHNSSSVFRVDRMEDKSDGNISLCDNLFINTL